MHTFSIYIYIYIYILCMLMTDSNCVKFVGGVIQRRGDGDRSHSQCGDPRSRAGGTHASCVPI